MPDNPRVREPLTKEEKKQNRRETGAALLAVAVAGPVGGAAAKEGFSRHSSRAEIKRQNKDGYKYGGSVSQTGRRRSRTRAAPQNGTAKRAWLFSGLALVTWLAVRR